MFTTEGGASRTRLFAWRCTVWKREDGADICPDFSPFSFTLPRTTILNGFERPLPPSYSVNYDGTRSLFVEYKYSVYFEVVSIRDRTFNLFTFRCHGHIAVTTKMVPSGEIKSRFETRTRNHKASIIVRRPCLMINALRPSCWLPATLTGVPPCGPPQTRRAYSTLHILTTHG